jgi:hypothetical protein
MNQCGAGPIGRKVVSLRGMHHNRLWYLTPVRARQPKGLFRETSLSKAPSG